MQDTKPPARFKSAYEVFVEHYRYHEGRKLQSDRDTKGVRLSKAEPTIGEIMMTSGLPERTVARYRTQYRRELALRQSGQDVPDSAF